MACALTIHTLTPALFTSAVVKRAHFSSISHISLTDLPAAYASLRNPAPNLLPSRLGPSPLSWSATHLSARGRDTPDTSHAARQERHERRRRHAEPAVTPHVPPPPLPLV